VLAVLAGLLSLHGFLGNWTLLANAQLIGAWSLPLRNPEAIGAIFFVGLIWGLAYQRTGSLRWCVVGHMLANLLGLAALVLLSMYDPTIR